MFTRREFIRTSAIAGSALIFFHPFANASLIAPRTSHIGRRILTGNPRTGCSTPNISNEVDCDINSGVEVFEQFAFLVPPNNGGYC